MDLKQRAARHSMEAFMLLESEHSLRRAVSDISGAAVYGKNLELLDMAASVLRMAEALGARRRRVMKRPPSAKAPPA